MYSLKKTSLLMLLALAAMLASCTTSNEPTKCYLDTDCEENEVCDRDASPSVCVDKSEKEPCYGKTCLRGVCDPEHPDQCMNPETCSNDENCTENFFCHKEDPASDGTCLDKATLCKKCTDSRGVCDPDNPKQCINKNPCTEDRECLNGLYCENGTCLKNTCKEESKTCDRGVCDFNKSPAECKSKSPCEVERDCLDNQFCVEGTNGEGACVEKTEACKDCRGNRICSNDGKEVKCKETDTCTSKLDCNGTKLCADNNTCQEPTSTTCNDPTDPTAAIPINTSANEIATVDAALCNNDVDEFLYTIRNATADGSDLVVTVSINPKDVGVGGIKVEVFDQNNDSVGVVELTDTSATPTSASLTVSVPGNTSDNYKIKVTALSEPVGGTLKYTLTARNVPDETKSACGSAVGLTSGNTVQGNTGDANSTAITASCGISPETSSDAVYKFTLTEQSFVSLQVELPAASTDAFTLSLRNECLGLENEVQCATKTGTSTQVPPSIHRVLEPGTYFVVVQEDGSALGKTFDLKYEATAVECVPGAAICENDRNLKVCNRTGTGSITIDCGDPATNNGCDRNNNKCVQDGAYVTGNTCQNPFLVLNDKLELSGSVTDITADYSPIGGICNLSASGNDIVARVDAKRGEQIYANFGFSGADSSVYVLKGGCTDLTNECVAYTDDHQVASDSESILYTVEESNTYYIVGDSNGITTSDWNLEVEVGNTVCQPGTFMCDGATVVGCKPSSFGYFDSRTCATGCDPATAACNPEPNSVCADAKDITNETKVVGYFSDYSKDYSADAATSCAKAETKGPDAFYVINPAVGDVIDVTLTAKSEAYLMFASGCDLGTQCIDSKKYATSGMGVGPKTLRYVAKNADPLYVVVDAMDENETKSFTLDIQRQQPLCTAGATKCKNGTVLEICSADGLTWDEHTCDACVETAGVAGCQTADGQTCKTPKPITGTNTTDGAVIKGKFVATDHNDFNPGEGVNGGCDFPVGKSGVGYDHFYSVTVPAGEVLEVKKAANVDSMFTYLLDSCAYGSCMAHSGYDSTTHMRYYNDSKQPKELILGVDLSVENTPANYTLTVKTYTPSCTNIGKGVQCISGNKELLVCAEDYTLKPTTCKFGCDQLSTGGACRVPAEDTCSTSSFSYDVTNGAAVIRGNLADMNPDHDHGGDRVCESGNGNSAKGPDAVYPIVAPSGTVVTVTVTPETAGGDIASYAISDCDDANTCLGGIDGDELSSPNTSEYKVLVPTSGKFFVIVDQASSVVSDNEYTLNVSQAVPTICTPNQVTCTINPMSNAGTLSTCGKYGLTESLAMCANGCNVTNDDCSLPKNDICKDDALPILPFNTTIYGSFDGATATVEAPANPKCEGLGASSKGRGPELFYKLEGTADEYATITVNADDPSIDILLYVLNSCETNGQKCLKGKDGFGKKEILEDVKIPKEGYMIVVVDTFSTPALGKGNFTISASVRSPNCGEGEVRCNDDQKAQGKSVIEVCNKGGYAFEPTIYCGNLGCNTDPNYCNGTNSNHSNDTCADAIEVDLTNNSTATFSAAPENFNNTYQVTNAVCPGIGRDTNGKDAVYLVKAPTGSIVKVTAEPLKAGESSYIALFATNKDCVNLDTNGCYAVANTHTSSSKEPEVMKFYFDDSKTINGGVYVVVDTVDGYTVNPFKVTFEVEAAVCEAGVQTKCLGNNKLQTCNKLGDAWETEFCPDGCSGTPAACNAPTNNLCLAAKEVPEGGGIVRGNLNNATDDYNLTGTCGNMNVDPASTVTPTDGNDLVYKITGSGKDILKVRSVANDSANLMLYALGTACKTSTEKDQTTCIAGNYDPNNDIVDLEVVFPGNSGDQSELYIVVDSKAGSAPAGAFELIFTVEKHMCDTGETRCNGGNTLETCNARGTGYDVVNCAAGCAVASNSCNPLENNTCATVNADVTGGGVFKGDLSTGYDADYLCSTNDFGTKGADAIYKVDLQAGETLEAKLDTHGNFASVLWISDECKTNGACIEYADNSAGSSIPLKYTATKGGTYYLFVDYAPDWPFTNLVPTNGEYTLTVNITVPPTPNISCTANEITCVNGQRVECNANGDGLTKTICSYGCDTTTHECKTVKNDVCDTNALTLLENGKNTETVYGKPDDFANNYDNVSGCLTQTYDEGDAVYQVQLDANDILTLDFESNFQSAVIITQDCSGFTSSGGNKQCLAAAEGDSEAYTLEYTAPASGMYYIIVNSKGFINSKSFKMTVAKTTAASPTNCTLGAPSCTNGVLTYCSPLQTNERTYDCPGQACTADACTTKNGEICANAIPVEKSGTYEGTFSTRGLRTFQPKPNTTYGSCTFDSTPKSTETYYKVVVSPNQKLDVTLMSPGNDDAALFLLGSSCDLNSCISQTAKGQYGSLHYEAGATGVETLYLVVDSYSLSDKPYELTIFVTN